MKKIIFILLFISPYLGVSQVLEIKNFQWETKPVIHVPDSIESKEPVVCILDDFNTEYAFNKNSELEYYYSRHRILHFIEPKSIDEYNKIYISVSSPLQLTVFKARSISKDGTVKEMLKGEMKEIEENGRKYMSLAVDGLETGSELEYYFTMQLSLSPWNTEILQTGIFTRNFHISFITPKHLPIESKSYNGAPTLKDSSTEKKNFYFCEIHNIPSYTEEKYTSKEAHEMRIEFKIAQNLKQSTTHLYMFSDATKQYYNEFNSLPPEDKKEIDKIATKINLKNKSEEEKTRDIENYIKSNFNITPSSDSKSFAEVAKTGSISPIRASILCYTLLKKAGVGCEIVLGVSKNKKTFDSDFESYNFLDDIFLHVPGPDKYIIPSNYIYRMGVTPEWLEGTNALFIKEISLGKIVSAIGTVQKIPASKIEQSGEMMDINIAFKEEMRSATEHIKRTFWGHSATAIRPFYFYDDPKKKEELGNDLIKTNIVDAKVSNLHVKNDNMNKSEVNEPFSVEADITYSSLCEKAGDHIVFSVGAVIGTQVEMYSEKPRQNPIEMEFPNSQDRKISINIPDGYTVKGVEGLNVNITDSDTSPSMGFNVTTAMKGNTIEINIHEYYSKTSYPVSYYETFRKVINASADWNKLTLIFSKG